MRVINVPQGIGDNIWLIQKLINTREQFIFQMSNKPPQRGKQIYDLIPELSHTCSYVPGLPYRSIMKLNEQNLYKHWKNFKRNIFYLSMNKHLERGNRIEEFLPDLETAFRIPWVTSVTEARQAVKILYRNGMGDLQTRFIGIYGSAYSTQRAWGFWDENKWLELIKLCYAHDNNYKFVIIGAEWDTDLGRNLMALLDKEQIPYVNTIGETLGTVIELMKRLTYFFSFPSGLGILAPTVECPVMMFYPESLRLMINAWASWEDIKSGAYKGMEFIEPGDAFEWAAENKKI